MLRQYYENVINIDRANTCPPTFRIKINRKH